MCSIQRCNKPDEIRYEPLAVDLCEEDWKTFAAMPLAEGLAWLEKRMRRQKTLFDEQGNA